LTESWNGTRWTIVPSPNAPHGFFDSLNSVSCVSARSCTAVGSFNPSQNALSTLIESWNGTRWTIVPSPNRPHSHMLDSLAAVSCLSARSCTAVGTYGLAGQTLIESWNGVRWTIVPSPNRGGAGGESVLLGLSCLSASACTAVGYAVGAAGGSTLVESWNGSRWIIVPSPNTGGANAFDQLNSVSCVSVSSCTAVGTYGVSPKTLVESWNGTQWAIVPSPNPPPPPPSSAGYSLMGVSCTSAAVCIAVGTPAREASPPHIGALAELGTSAR
jgi:hypothetical protein